MTVTATAIKVTIAATGQAGILERTFRSGAVVSPVTAAGLSIPFLALGLAYSRVKPVYNRVRRYMGAVNYASGALIIVVGILIFTDSLINLNSLFNFGLLGDVSSEV